MKRFLNWKLFLLFIVLLAGFLRFYNLGSIPSSLFRDEVSIGYNAYSIMTTGKDEHGILLPPSLQAIGDQKLPVYIYSTIPFVKIFGLSDFTPRLPAAVAGIFLVLLTYLLAEELFKKRSLSILTSFMMAISPWGVFSSRITYEPTLSLFFIVLAVIFYLKSVKNKYYIYYSALLFGISLFTYHGSQIFVPVFLIGLIILTNNIWSKNKKDFIVSGFIFLLIAFFALTVTFKGGATKISGIGIFNNSAIQYSKIERPRNEHPVDDFIVKLLYNKYTAYPFVIGENYLSAFSPDFLFNKGDRNPWQNMEDMGYFYLIDSLFIFLGFSVMLKKNEKGLKILLLWLFTSPIPGSITIDAPGASRTLTILIPLIFFSSYGIYFAIQYFLKLKSKKMGRFLIVVLSGSYLISFIYFLDYYFVLFTVNRAIFYGYGYKQEAQISSESSVKKVILSGLYDYTYPYFLYYLSYPADKFRSEVKYAQMTSDNFLPVKSFDKYNFVNTVNWKAVCKDDGVLVFEAYSNFPKTIKPDGIIYLPDKTPRFGYITMDKSKCSNFENSLNVQSIVK